MSEVGIQYENLRYANRYRYTATEYLDTATDIDFEEIRYPVRYRYVFWTVAEF